MIGDVAIERLKRAVLTRTGHHYYVDKDKLLYERARERMQVRGLTFEAYVELLERGDGDEWRRFEEAITIGETYFFRYPDHFAALREKVLPKLIAARRDVRALRIWSIGCSNGAEPYSVAILLRGLLGDEVDGWRIALIGGDISEKALSAARSGRYNAWALRTMPPEDRERYFHADGSTFVLKREFRTMVRFERQNILDLLSPTAPLEWSGFDLILCRNVLIYFSPRQALEIVGALRRCVAPDGALFLGHAEAMLASHQPLLGAPDAAGLPTEFSLAVQPPVAEPIAYVPPVMPPLPKWMTQPMPRSQALRQDDPDDIATLQQLADAGAYEEAGRLCAQMLGRDPTSARLHYYSAVLQQVSDDLAGAEASLRRALYLDRSFVVAHHRLGMLLLALGRTGEARRALQTAVQLSGAAAPDAELAEGRGVSAGELREAAQEQLAMLGEAA